VVSELTWETGLVPTQVPSQTAGREMVDPVPAGQLAVLAVSAETSMHPFPEGEHVHAGEHVTVAGGVSR
jgi:hypothetical protein